VRLLKLPRADWKIVGITAAADLLAWLLVLVLFSFTEGLLLSTTEQFSLAESIADVPESQVESMLGQFQAFFYQFLFLLIGTVIVIALIFSTSRAFIWARVLKKPFTKRYFRGSLALAALFLGIALAGTFLALALQPNIQQYFFLAFLLLSTYFGFYSYLHLSDTGSIKGGFTSAFRRWDLFLLHLLIFIALILLQQRLNTLALGFQAIGLVGMFALLGWLRFFLLERYQKRGG